MYRIEKVNELIKQELGKIILTEEEFGAEVLVTVMGVQTSDDLRHATVSVSALPTQEGKAVLKKLTAHAPNLQYLLNKKLKMHPVPKIRFALDETESNSQKIENLLNEIKDDKS